ncbi:DUF551 domain-containing protein [Klebsiella pneumoniae]|uniref:DUF551 domain-containing protein n=2 Tax=Klebsiella pneumoniae TaxID=573 RepID=UPI00359C694E
MESTRDDIPFGFDESGNNELAAFKLALAAMDSEPVEMPLDYLQGHKDGLEWAAQLAEANHPETGDWLYDDPIELAKAIRKGPDMPPSQPALDTEPDRNPVLGYADSYRDMAKQGVESVPIWSVITDLERNIAPLYRHAQQAPEHPEVLPCSVLLEPGLRFGKGIKTSTMLAALARRAVHESDMAALSPEERAEFQAGIEDFKSLIAQQPVVPDEKPMPNSLSMYAVDAVAAIAEVKGWNACRTAMLQELKKSAGTEAICRSDENVQVLHTKSPAQSYCCPAQNQGWIPVSEQMPEVGDIVLTAMGGAVNVGEMECSAANCRFFTSVISGRELPATHWMPLPAGPKEDINALIPLVSRNEQEVK